MKTYQIMLLLVAVGLIILVGLAVMTSSKSLNSIKSKTVGDGQHGTARWATRQELKRTYVHVPFDVSNWRGGKNRPKVQGIILGSKKKKLRKKKKRQITALVDADDIHCLMIGASGVGKTAFFLYPNLEYACASGMSFLALDTKGGATRCETRSVLQTL